MDENRMSLVSKLEKRSVYPLIYRPYRSCFDQNDYNGRSVRQRKLTGYTLKEKDSEQAKGILGLTNPLSQRQPPRDSIPTYLQLEHRPRSWDRPNPVSSHLSASRGNCTCPYYSQHVGPITDLYRQATERT